MQEQNQICCSCFADKLFCENVFALVVKFWGAMIARAPAALALFYSHKSCSAFGTSHKQIVNLVLTLIFITDGNALRLTIEYWFGNRLFNREKFIYNKSLNN